MMPMKTRWTSILACSLALMAPLSVGNAQSRVNPATESPVPEGLLNGRWEMTFVNDHDPGRCLSPRDVWDNVVTFHKDGKYEFSHQHGDDVGKWMLRGRSLAVQVRGSDGKWYSTFGEPGATHYAVTVISRDHIILKAKGAAVERLRRCRF